MHNRNAEPINTSRPSEGKHSSSQLTTNSSCISENSLGNWCPGVANHRMTTHHGGWKWDLSVLVIGTRPILFTEDGCSRTNNYVVLKGEGRNTCGFGSGQVCAKRLLARIISAARNEGVSEVKYRLLVRGNRAHHRTTGITEKICIATFSDPLRRLVQELRYTSSSPLAQYQQLT